MMKKIVVLIVLLALAGFSCTKCSKIIKPEHKPVDWEGYNDVHTVYWNFTGRCSDFKTLGGTGMTIKMHGKMCDHQNPSPRTFYLRDNSSLVETNNAEDIIVKIWCSNYDEHEAIQSKFDVSDLTKTCYVTGELAIMDYQDGRCCITEVEIFIDSADDIYFE